MAAANRLFTKTAFKKVPPLYSQEFAGDKAIARVKFFSLTSGWRWYITEYDPETGTAFGLVQGHEIELGHISVTELQELNDNFRKHGFRFPPIERDLHYSAKTLGEIRQQLSKGHAP